MRFWEVSLTLESWKYWFFMIRRAVGIYDSYHIIYHLTSYEVISIIRAWLSHIAQQQQQEQHARIAINTQYLSFIILVFFCSISLLSCLTLSTLSPESLREVVTSGSERASSDCRISDNDCPIVLRSSARHHKRVFNLSYFDTPLWSFSSTYKNTRFASNFVIPKLLVFQQVEGILEPLVPARGSNPQIISFNHLPQKLGLIFGVICGRRLAQFSIFKLFTMAQFELNYTLRDQRQDIFQNTPALAN